MEKEQQKMTNYPIVKLNQPKWVRSENGILFGVCEGIGEAFQVDPNKLRIFLFITAVFFGTGIFAYLLLGLVLPRRDRLKHYNQHKFLGVCHRLHIRTGTELGIIRLLVISSTLASAGVVLLGYFALALFMPYPNEKIAW